MRPIKVGRPKKYTKEFIENEAAVLGSWLKERETAPFIWIKDFATERGYHQGKISDFANENEIFASVLEAAYQIQEGKIVSGAITGELNPTFSMFLLKCKFGYNDGNVRKIEIKSDNAKAIELDPIESTDNRTAEVARILLESGAFESKVEEIDGGETVEVQSSHPIN